MCLPFEQARKFFRRNASKFVLNDLLKVYSQGNLSDVLKMNKSIQYRFNNEEYHLLDKDLKDFLQFTSIDYKTAKKFDSIEGNLYLMIDACCRNHQINYVESFITSFNLSKFLKIIEESIYTSIRRYRIDIAKSLFNFLVRKTFCQSAEKIKILDKIIHTCLSLSFQYDKKFTMWMLHEMGYNEDIAYLNPADFKIVRINCELDKNLKTNICKYILVTNWLDDYKGNQDDYFIREFLRDKALSAII